MYVRERSVLLFILSLILAFAYPLAAQSGAGSIQGTVTDATGAVIPAATVHVVNTATGTVNDTKANDSGFYQIPGLFTGSYHISITAPGMTTYTGSIELLVAQTAIINPVLTIGAVTHQVVVNENTIQLTTPDSGAITATLERDRIDQLPENGRELINLTAMTVPGLETGGTRANGMLPEALQYVADGVATTNLHYGAENNPKMQLQDPDSVQEVQVNMNSASAQYSTPATAIISTKSGSNTLHGTAFETARNNAIGVAKARSDAYNFVAPPLVRNEFGISAGGPIILPQVYHGKDKSFWFFAYERYSNAQSSTGNYTVPTMAMRQGDFSGLTSGNTLQTLFDPATTTNASTCAYTGTANPYCRTPFPGNVIPSSEISPAAKSLFELEPQPTSTANPLEANNLTASNSSFAVIPQVTFRLDHIFNESNRAYLRFSDVQSAVNYSGGPRSLAAEGIPAGAAEGYTNTPGQTFLASIGYTHIFSPTFFAETIIGQQWWDLWSLVGAEPGTNYEAKLGLPNNFGQAGFPSTSGLINNFSSSQTSTTTAQIITDLQENLTKIMGPHQFLFGGSARHERMADEPTGLADSIAFGVNPTALYDISTKANYTALTHTGYADASFFLGSANSYTVNLEPPHLHYHMNEFDAYFQDNYHMTKNLTVDLGLRYEAHPAPWNKYGLASALDFKNDAVVLATPASQMIAEGYTTQAIINNDEYIGMKFETPQEAGMPGNTTLMRNYDLNLLPRVGLAYQLFGGKYGTVIRGGYGRYTYQTPMENYLNHTQKQNPFTATYKQDYNSASQSVDSGANELIRYNAPAKFGVMGQNTADVVDTTSTTAITPGISWWSNSPNWAPSAVTETNFTIEQPLKGNSALRISYIWTHSTNLDVSQHFNYNPTAYQWEMATGTAVPTGGASVIGTPAQNTYSSTAMGPYNQTLWASGSSQHMKTGWSNANALQVNYQRIYQHGIAYQLYYVWSKGLRVGGDQQALSQGDVYPYSAYPGAMGTVGTITSPYGTIGPARIAPPPPAGVAKWDYYRSIAKFQDYGVMTNAPFHHIQFNGVVDLPVGRGKRFFGNVNRVVDEMIGGFQIAGVGSIVTQEFQPPQNWGAISPLRVYKHKYPITDCRSGTCYKAYLWYNGYLGPKVTQGVAGSTCTKNCVTGLPADYVASQTPIDNDPTSTYYQANEVQITAPNINSGKATNIVYDAGPVGAYPYSHTWLLGPWNWNADASIFKVFSITERVKLRVDMDAFNAFNVQGYTNPGTAGIEQVQPGVGQASSANTARQIQITARLNF